LPGEDRVPSGGDRAAIVQTSDAVERLRALASCAAEIGARHIAQQTVALADRLAEGRFYVACLGQFKRGKSTLLNALVGQAVLPTGVVPVTSVVTVLRFGPAPVTRVHYRDRAAEEVLPDRLADFVTEAGNPGNGRSVTVVEVFAPSDILRDGLCLVDTPGIGSTSTLATEVTRAFVPHVDAALVVLGADPPISGEEVQLVGQVQAETAQFVFVINKADRLDEAELAEVELHTRQVLRDRLGLTPDSMFVVSAAERLTRGQPTRDWSRLERALSALCAESRAGWLERRAEWMMQRVGRQTLQALDETAQAIRRPAAEGERRIAGLHKWLAGAQQALSEFALLLAAEQRSVAQEVRREGEGHLARARAAAVAELAREVGGAPVGRFRLRRAALGLAQQVARRAVEQVLVVLEDRAGRAYRTAVTRFIRMANDLLTRLADTEPRLAELPPLEPRADLGGTRRFYFTEMMTLTAAGPWDWLTDLAAPRPVQRRRAAARARAYLERLLATNTSRVVNDLDDRLVESRRDLEAEIRERLGELVASADRAAAGARAVREAGEAAMAAELERLSAVGRRVKAVVAGKGKSDPI
jgi:GTP-binding protein EngB required for normal cell division